MSARSIAHRHISTLGFFRTLPARLLALSTLARSRKGLMRLDDHLLRDIGMTAEEARAEASRPVWDAPSHWKA